MRRRHDVVETLRQQIISALHFGTLPPDARLPSARSLAELLQADARVVVAAYRTLEREGLVEQRPPSRAFFAVTDSPAGVRARLPRGRGVGSRDRVLREPWLAATLAGALERDIPVPAFPEYARRAVETILLRAACVECNADQRVWLCRELSEDYGIEAVGVELDAAAAALADLSTADHTPNEDPAPVALRPLAPALRRADLLVTTATHAPLVRALADRTGKASVIVTHRAELVAELERLLARGPVYFIGTDPRFSAKLRTLFAPWARVGHVRPIILDIDDPRSIPAGAPAYVMRTARDRLGGVPPQVRALPTLRVFSAETRTHLLRFIVEANLRASSASSRMPLHTVL